MTVMCFDLFKSKHASLASAVLSLTLKRHWYKPYWYKKTSAFDQWHPEMYGTTECGNSKNIFRLLCVIIHMHILFRTLIVLKWLSNKMKGFKKICLTHVNTWTSWERKKKKHSYNSPLIRIRTWFSFTLRLLYSTVVWWDLKVGVNYSSI